MTSQSSLEKTYASILNAVAKQSDPDTHSKKIRTGYLQHAPGPRGIRIEEVTVKNEYGDRWLVHYEGKWRRVHIQVNRTYIIYRGEKITVQIDGL